MQTLTFELILNDGSRFEIQSDDRESVDKLGEMIGWDNIKYLEEL